MTFKFSDILNDMERLHHGQRLDQYTILEPLGEGGMGEVYLAHDEKLDRKIAIKVLTGESAKNPMLVQRFENEAKTLAALNHPNIVGVYNYGVHDETPFIAMEYVEGKNLKSVLSSRSFGIGEAITCLKEICDGLQAAHQKGVIHRDIKPHNIIVTKSGRSKLVDFGIAKDFSKDDQDMTQTEHIVGTVSYLAPEIIVGQRPSNQSDIFSLGIVLFEMLEGRNPFTDDSKFQSMDNIRNREVRLSKEVLDILPKGLYEIMRKMLAKAVTARYQDLSELKLDLDKIDVNAIPNELIAANRPEAMILNEQNVRMSLLSKGFKTREVGMIISLAAQIQEQALKFEDKTIPLDKKSKLAISRDALDKAVDKYESAKKAISSPKIEAKRTLELSFSKSTSILGGSLAAIGLLIIAFNFSKIRDAYDLARIDDSPLEKPLSGNLYTNHFRAVNGETGEILDDSYATISTESFGISDFTVNTIDDKGQFHSKTTSNFNPFIPPVKQTYKDGWEERIITTGDYNKIFPLRVGKSMTYISHGNHKKWGPWKNEKICTVTDKKIFRSTVGRFPVFVVECKRTDQGPHKGITFIKYYSPDIKGIIHSERRDFNPDTKGLDYFYSTTIKIEPDTQTANNASIIEQ